VKRVMYVDVMLNSTHRDYFLPVRVVTGRIRAVAVLLLTGFSRHRVGVSVLVARAVLYLEVKIFKKFDPARLLSDRFGRPS